MDIMTKMCAHTYILKLELAYAQIFSVASIFSTFLSKIDWVLNLFPYIQGFSLLISFSPFSSLLSFRPPSLLPYLPLTLSLSLPKLFYHRSWWTINVERVEMCVKTSYSFPIFAILNRVIKIYKSRCILCAEACSRATT